MKKLLALTLSLLMPVALFACQKEEEPPALTDEGGQVTVQSPFADTNTYGDRYYLADSKAIVYGDDVYYMDYSRLISVPLAEVIKHNIIEEGGRVWRPEKINALCTDPMCVHESMTCPIYLTSSISHYLVDAVESKGGLPVIYYNRSTAGNVLAMPGTEADFSFAEELVRFDTAQASAEQVTLSPYPIKQFIAYGDYLYYLTNVAEEKYEFNAVKKTGGSVNTLSLPEGYFTMIGANEQGVYLNDDEGNVYAFDLKGEGFDLIYTVAEVYPLGYNRPAELDMLVEGEYLYFFADFEIRSLPYHGNDRTVDFINHNIRRVKLDDPSGEGELVAEDVYEKNVYGVYNGELYYGPFDVNAMLDSSEYTSSMYTSRGTIRAVDLETLESRVVVYDSGFEWSSPTGYYINDRCIIGANHTYRNLNGYDTEGGLGYATLYSFEDGALYCITPDVDLVRPEQ